MKYEELENKPEYDKLQPGILQFWKENNIFEKSVNERDGEEVVFYDGPPFPTGKPHHGTVLVSFIKDMIARYWTMRGKVIDSLVDKPDIIVLDPPRDGIHPKALDKIINFEVEKIVYIS